MSTKHSKNIKGCAIHTGLVAGVKIDQCAQCMGKCGGYPKYSGAWYDCLDRNYCASKCS